ncbi:hypothetical protein CAEBREN_08752 [Caenorhabditis brenneri]|uniref:Poly(A) RNA polymerase mitochondrial-like central palm domain-containing protein n=1 Tax=Caenorhabditis brenneri TaxID=135651 RepID=G0N2I8_CAEBE|nr:hypothetical protein CAEBREN_08752 [Caenorhabditis brenneri]
MSAKHEIESRLRAIGAPKDGEFTKHESLTSQWDKSLKKFSDQIEQYYIENRQINGVQYEMKAVVPFGSSASGLGMTGGDLDMIVCVHPPLGKKAGRLVKRRCNDILEVIFKKIQCGDMLKTRKLEEMEHIDGARVPIITGKVDGVDLDISISMTYTVSAQYLASKFIDAYEKYDRRFILLAAFVKAWQKSKKTDQNEDYFRTVFPNSCSTVLLVVFFMKHYKLLPNINKKHWAELSDARATWPRVRQGENGSFGIPRQYLANWNTCDVSVGTLFFLFIDFYANIMDFKNYRMVIEDGSLRRKGKRRTHRVVIEDVIDSDNPAKSVTEEGMFVNWLKKAITIVKSTEAEGIFDELMKDKLRDIMSYTKQEVNELRQRGLHAAPWPPVKRY